MSLIDKNNHFLDIILINYSIILSSSVFYIII